MKRIVFAMALVCGCAQEQRVVRFVVPSAADPIDTLTRALAQSGYTPAGVDRQSGIVTTRWEDTGFLYGQLQNVGATIVRRYTITVGPASTGSEVLVRADTQRCAQGTAVITDAGVNGVCERMDGLVPKHQEDLDELGGKLRQALHGR
jgi:hypothetical protein